ncbi:TonB family protein [Serratia sp. BIGb0234]|uniref:TonB family protein n=1 Tax=Serratia sp. BIGb0234 TaxID=2940614 RepID=UPI00216928CC|nr:TonB family protein [Serratia sp. BIGb0234]MCS4320744.1 TonB family protein [Serratia sp. BIGb0234]
MRKSTFAALLLLCLTPALAIGATQAPHAIIKTAPVYPEQALSKSTSGVVKVKYDIEHDGTVSHVRIVQAKPAGVFDEAVLTAMKSWRFERDQPVKDREFTINFTTKPTNSVYGNGVPFR